MHPRLQHQDQNKGSQNTCSLHSRLAPLAQLVFMPPQRGDCLQAAQQGLPVVGGYTNLQRLQQAPELLWRQASHAVWIHLQRGQQSERCLLACKRQYGSPLHQQCTLTVAEACYTCVGVQQASVRVPLHHLPCPNRVPADQAASTLTH